MDVFRVEPFAEIAPGEPEVDPQTIRSCLVAADVAVEAEG
ncbi:hypothetical protein SAMN05444320_102728 [Streptoalloteichus hindustanus]|uniref:Uncharacterized protein n=1 Tax=Streptoalloteichus hindustanus TaxID=2017 RepID=A0A1M4ZGC5_STRHI|nr:hypothetical protein SAMN05444320_102728 [Streptoalloteichus hindustanus]